MPGPPQSCRAPGRAPGRATGRARCNGSAQIGLVGKKKSAEQFDMTGILTLAQHSTETVNMLDASNFPCPFRILGTPNSLRWFSERQRDYGIENAYGVTPAPSCTSTARQEERSKKLTA